MASLALKNARVELKTTQEAKELLTKAAALDGLDLSTFLLLPAIEKARAILRDHALIAMSAEAQAKLAELLLAQPEPTEAMRELRALPRLKARA